MALLLPEPVENVLHHHTSATPPELILAVTGSAREAIDRRLVADPGHRTLQPSLTIGDERYGSLVVLDVDAVSDHEVTPVIDEDGGGHRDVTHRADRRPEAGAVP